MGAHTQSPTLWMLLAKYAGDPTIPAETVCAEYFGEMEYRVFLAKVAKGDINLPLIRMTESRKAPKYVHVADLAAYIDRQAEQARRETKNY